MWLEQVRQDVRFGAVLLRRNPAFALVAILTLALGIGLTTAVFSVVNAVLVRPLPYPHADRLVWLTRYNTLMKSEVVSGIDFLDWKEQSKSFDEIVAYGYSRKTLVAVESAEQHWFAEVTAGFWDLSGATPAHGSLFTARDRDALVLSDGLFERRFGRDPAVIGSVVTLNGRPVTIIGVLPRGFQFVLPQPGLSAWRRARSASDLEGYLLNPISPGSEVRGGPMSIQLVSARLRTGVPLANANSELQQIHTRISAGNGGASVGWSAPRVMLLQEKLVGDARLALLILSGARGPRATDSVREHRGLIGSADRVQAERNCDSHRYRSEPLTGNPTVCKREPLTGFSRRSHRPAAGALDRVGVCSPCAACSSATRRGEPRLAGSAVRYRNHFCSRRTVRIRFDSILGEASV